MRIKCVNQNCTAPNKSFEWDESRRLKRGGHIATPHAEGAVRLAVGCPYCMTDNVVWLTGVKMDFGLTRKLGDDDGS